MTTPTLVDAARAHLDGECKCQQLCEMCSCEPSYHGMCECLDTALRSAIDREAERQEIIEGLVEAALISRNCLSDMLARYDAMEEDDR